MELTGANNSLADHGARSNTGIVGSNTTQGMNVCVRLFCVCGVLPAGNGLATG
jgi:hypothetical protein